MPPRHPSIAHALGLVRRRLQAAWEAAPGATPRRLHVACSGGADSVALLGLLHLLSGRDGLALSVGHVDHGLRPTSGHEAQQVVALATSLGLPVAVGTPGLSTGPGLPARARQARRQVLTTQAQQHGASMIVLGHTATDQAETILLHLTRGAGLAGLSAMSEYEPGVDGTLVGCLRPMLDLSRAEARALAQRLGHRFVDDPTNEDRSHPRVRIRHQVLPALARQNPRVEQALARAATHARQAEHALQVWVSRELHARRRPATDGGASEVIAGARVVDRVGQAHTDPRPGCGPDVTSGARWSTEGMERVPSAIRTRFIQRVCRAAGAPDDAMSAQTLASIDDALAHPGPARTWDLHPAVRLRIDAGELWAEPQTCRDPRGQPLTP